MKKWKTKIQLNISTWEGDSKDLFDYETDEININSFSISSSFCFLLSNQGLTIQNLKNQSFNNPKNVSNIEISNDGIFYNSEFENKKFFERSYLICRPRENYIDSSEKDLKNEYYEINQGDVIKLGRLYLKIRELVIDGKIINKKTNIKKNILNRLTTNHSFNFNNNKKKIKKLCRVCYSDEKEVESPLISPCKCIGGLKYIHLSCLRNWIETRAILKENESNEDCLKYVINQVICEICKEPYPDFIYSNDKDNFFEIFDFIQMKYDSYVIFETIPIDEYNENEDNYNKRQLFILSFNEKNYIHIGRSHNTDMKLNDITVSRYHCKIIINRDKKKYYIRDLGSKFGTGILIQNNKMKLNSSFPFYIQISRSTISITINKCCWCFCNCFNCNTNEEKQIYKYYGKYNSDAIIIEKIFKFKQSNEDEDEDEEEKINISNNDSFYDKNKDSDRIIIPKYINNKIDDTERLNLNKNKNTVDNSEATIISTLISPNTTSLENKTNSFIKNGRRTNIKNIKNKILKQTKENIIVNSDNNIEEEPKEENENENNEMNYNVNEENNNRIIYDYEENVENSNNSLMQKNERFKGNKELHISSMSFNKSFDKHNNENIDNNENNNVNK